MEAISPENQTNAEQSGPETAPEDQREEVDKLREFSTPYDDLVEKLAREENQKREEIRNMLKGKVADDSIEEAVTQLGDYFSTEFLKREKERGRALFDEMLEIRNRGALIQEMPQLLALEKREEKDCSVLMMDLDHFKDVNDTYGHPAGDQALKALAKIITGSIRKSDFVYRYGGEEFAVVLLGTNSTEAFNIAEKIRRSVEETGIEITDVDGNKKILNKTISIGYSNTSQFEEWKTGFGAPEGMEKRLIDSADSALYLAKQSGRNKTVSFGEEI